MKEFSRRVVLGVALLASAVIIWYLGQRLLDLTGALIDLVGPIWALIIVGGVTTGLAAVWIRYGGAGALGRWGVTIKPATPLDLGPDDSEQRHAEGASADLPGTAGRRGPGDGR